MIKAQFVLKDVHENKVNKKQVSDKVSSGLKNKRSKLWKIISRTYSHVKKVLKQESIRGNKVRVTVCMKKKEDPVDHFTWLYGNGAPDTWQSGNIILEGNLEVALDLVSVKLV